MGSGRFWSLRDEKVLIFTSYLNTVDLIKSQVEAGFNVKARMLSLAEGEIYGMFRSFSVPHRAVLVRGCSYPLQASLTSSYPIRCGPLSVPWMRASVRRPTVWLRHVGSRALLALGSSSAREGYSCMFLDVSPQQESQEVCTGRARSCHTLDARQRLFKLPTPMKVADSQSLNLSGQLPSLPAKCVCASVAEACALLLCPPRPWMPSRTTPA